ncbi:biotin-independent malonate decarboxylase subunit gamma [Segnochrobactrum spirostomi]|uniref:Biotin-independent malonate decarboxylase subunit gamma n=1 Tax=Segnochrobactrum spirostomi TaxID=2608987 RepID=A0A6A7YBN4_9HYPH|nr:biotin-independent malonate decarboxylase subunit gamma [Segnochrobactrum spirostomi]MQT14829.1 biotin-independent malonate decarboxylase subunit gamma [Segnochrobactrum spirostomi]
MTLDEVLAALFPAGHAVARGPHGTVSGTAKIDGAADVAVIGIVDGTSLGIDGALVLAGHVLDLVETKAASTLVVLVDTSSQTMARRDELLGLNEFLAHLGKCLSLAALEGVATIGVLYGPAAAGAFISTALSTQILVALPDASPSVMDLPSISRVTKLPLEELTALAKTTPIFAPGLEPLYATGAIAETWSVAEAAALLKAAAARGAPDFNDTRDVTGFERKGRLQAHAIAARVVADAAGHG